MLDQEFQTELTTLLNRHSIDNETNTPDYILAEFLVNQLRTWTTSLLNTVDWYGWETLSDRMGMRRAAVAIMKDE